MPIDLTGLPSRNPKPEKDQVDLSGLPNKTQDILRTQYRTDPTTPEKEAQVYDIAKRTQLPSQTVRSDVAKAKRIADEPDWESLQREAPNLAAKLRENPDLFRVAKGSLDELSAFEKVTKALGVQGLAELTFRAPEAIQRNLMTLDRNLNPMHELYRRAILDNPAYADLKARGALPEQASEFVLNNPLMEQLQRPVEFSSTIADAIGEQIEYEGQETELGQYIGDTMERANVATMAAINGDFGPLGELLTDPKAMGVMVGQGAASLAVALASRGNILPIMLMEGGEAASEIARLEKETGVKISDEDYLLATTMKALIGGYLERAGAGGFAFDEASGALSALMRILSSTAGEAGTEFGQALTGNVAKLLTYDKDANPAEDLLASSIAGFGLGLGVQSTTEAGYGTKALVDASMQKKFVERQKKVLKADQSSAVVSELMARARDAKLRELSPDAFEEVVEAQVADTELAEVYFDSQDLADHYAQQDMTIDEALADMPDVLQQWYDVEATGGGDVVVPLQKITRHLLDRPEDAGLENHVRFNADDLSKMEAESYRQTDAQDEFAEEADRIIKEKSDDELFVASVKAVEDHAFAQLETANRFSSDVNRTYAKIVANFYTVYAGRLGTTPEEMAKRYPLPINAVTARGPQISYASDEQDLEPGAEAEFGPEPTQAELDARDAEPDNYVIVESRDGGFSVFEEDGGQIGTATTREEAEAIIERDKSGKPPVDIEGTEQQDNYFQDDRQLAPLNRAQKNNIGLFSAVEQAVIDMKLQSWNRKAANKNFTEADEKRLLELEDKVHIARLAAREAVFPAEEQANKIEVASQMRFYLAVTHFHQGATPEQLANPLEATGWGQDILQAVANGMTEAEAKTKHHELQDQYEEYQRKGRLANRAAEEFDESNTPDQKKLEKLKLRKRAKEVGGLASGKEIWQKVSKMPGVKNEELEVLGLEAFLNAGDKFSRDDVIQFVRNNGVEIEELVGTTDPAMIDEDEISWDEQIEENSENWQHYVEDYIYEFERQDFVAAMETQEGTNFQYFWNADEWIENNSEDILDALSLQDNRIPGQEDFMVGGEGDLGQAGDIQSLLLTAIEYGDALNLPDVEETVRNLMRSDFEEAAEKAAEESYMDNPYLTITSSQLPNTYIYGNDDVGWTVNDEFHDIYDLDEAKIQAVEAARDAGDVSFERDSDRAQWGDYIYDADPDDVNYRELKLTLPHQPGPQFIESAHFDDPNIVAFMRVTDRELSLDGESKTVTPRIHHQEETGQMIVRGDPNYVTAGYYILDEFEDGTVWQRSTTFETQEAAERRLRHWHEKQIRQLLNTYMVDESQSDWHQTAQTTGYTDPAFDRSAAVDQRTQLETVVNNDLEAVYQRLANMDDTDVQSKYGVFFESNAMVVPVQRESGIDGESVGAHSFVQYAWNILRNSPEAQSALLADLMPTGINQVAAYNYINQILEAELNDNDRRVLEQLVKEYDEVDAAVRRDVQGVPDAPFKDSAWVELSVRRALVDAVENGYKAFAWADTGMVIDRWNEVYAIGYESHYNEKWVSMVKKATKQKPRHFTWEGDEIPPPVKPRIIAKQITEEDLRNENVAASVRGSFQVGRWYWELEWPVDEDGNQRFRSSMTATGGQYSTEKDARKEAKRQAIIDYTDDVGYWIVPLTDEFVEKVRAEGLPLFQDQTRGLFTPETSTITLLEEANLSTFLHEFGHFQLEVMADLASQHGTPQEIKQDMQTILDWFGVENVNAWNRMSREEKREHHEKFARGFEKYLYTGRAPNSQLADIFARIREWFIQVYKDIRALNVTLTPEVTEVFDRLVATEEQIREAEELQGYRRLFKSEEESGMTPAQWRAYQDEAEKPSEDARRDLQNRALRDMQWLRNARSRELKALQAKAKEKRAAIREEVAEEVMAEPIQQAIQFLKTGETVGPDGEEINVEKGHRLATEALQEMYPETALGNRDWRALPTGRYGLRGKEGLHPDVVAGVFGFESGDDLVAELLAAENAKEKIEGITDTRMLEQYGELSSPEALEAAVDAAIHNEARTKLIATELVALEQATGKKRSLLRAAKQYAKDVIGNMEIRNVRKANRFAVTERKAAREAELALRRGDRELAAKHRRSQLVANLMYREALKAKDEVPKMLRLFNKFQKPGVRKNLDQQYLDQIDQLLERYELRSSLSQHQIDRRISLNNWVEAQTEATGGVEPAIDPRLLNEAARTHYTRLTLNEMRGLYDSIRSIEHIARWKKKLLTAKDKREFNARMDEVVASIENNATKVVKERMENNGPLDKAADGWHEWFAMHRKLGSIVRAMDGLKDGGPMWELLLRPANERADYETVEHEKATEALNDILKPIYSQTRMTKKIDIPGTDKRVSVEGRFVMLLNMGNAVNLDRLIEGELAHGWTEADFEAVKNSASKEEWDAVQAIWDYINGYWQEIAAKQARVTGVAPEKVEAQEVVTPHGTYRGGYFPIKYNAKRSRQSDANTANELLEQKRKGNYSAATTRRGHTKERGKSGTGPLRYDMGVITEHVSDVIHDLAWHEWAIDANRVVRDKGFEAVVRKHYGDPIVKLLTHAVEDIVIGDLPAKNMFERVINHLRIGSTIVGLGYSVFTAALQPFGLAQSIVRIGPQHVLRGMGRWFGSAQGMEDSVGWIFENSDFMRLRNKTMMREMDEVLNQVRGEKLTKLKASYFVLIAKAQMIADVPTWIGQYHKSMDVTGGDHAKSVALADQAVKDSQGSGLGMDRAEIQRGGPLLKIFTNFYSYFNATFNLLADSKSQTDFRKPKDVGLFVVDFMLLTILPATLAAISREAIYQLTGGDDEEDKDGAEIAMWLARENLSYLSGLMVGVREVSGALQGYYGYTGPAGLRFFGEFGKLMAQTGQAEVDEAFLKSLNQVGGLVFHYPAAQVERAAEGMVELAEGESSNPMVLLTGTE